MIQPQQAQHPGAMIEIRSVSKDHGRRRVLHGINFEARPGRVTGFVGANGAGKSSTLRILLGLDRASEGEAVFDNLPYVRLPNPIHRVGALLDGPGAHPARKVTDHLRWVAAAAGIGKRRVNQVLEQVGLAAAGHQQVRTLSLGMGQRLGLAAALLGDPDYLVLDEPANGLDPEGIRWLRELVRGQAAEGRTVLLSSHLMGELAEIADDIVVIASGRIVAHGSLAEIGSHGETLEDAFFALTAEAGR